MAISHSGGCWVRLDVYQTDLKALGVYSPLLPSSNASVIDSNRLAAKPFATWKSNSLCSRGLFEVSVLQTLVEPESLLVHMVDANILKRVNVATPTHYQGEIDLQLGLRNGVWSNVTGRPGQTRQTVEPVTVRGVLSRSGKAGDLWTLTLDHPIQVQDPGAANLQLSVQIQLLRFIGGREGPQDPRYDGKHVELTGTLVPPYGPGVAAVRVGTITPLK
jgi:hypothetical protein